MSTERIRLPHVGALDGLRGVAVAGVVIFHGGHLIGGYLGVDLFFVLSGFLITSLLLQEWGTTSTVALGSFWARRARRLLPALGVLIVGVALYAAIALPSTELGRLRGDALATIGYVANWHAIFRNLSYFDILRDQPSLLDHTWSLAIEEQFYVFWPLIFIGLAAWWKEHLPQAVLVTAILLGTVSTGLMAFLWDPVDVNRVYYGTDTRAFALFAGITIAAAVKLWGHPVGRVSRIALEAVGLCSAAFLAWMWISVDGQTGRLYRGGFLMAGIAGAILVACAANPRRGPIGWVLSFPVLRWLGLISYGLYLWHWPVDVVMTPEKVGLSGWPLFALQTAVALAIALLSYHLVEMPIRRGAISARQWYVALPATAVVLVAAIFLSTLGAKSADAQLTLQYTPHRGDEVLLVGDSVAQSLASGIDTRVRDFGLSWSAGCRLLHGKLQFASQYGGDCPWESAWGGVVDQIRPRTVIALIGIWDLFDIKLPGIPVPVGPGDPRWNAAYKAQLETMVAILGARGARVVLTTLPCAGAQNVTGVAGNFERGAFDINRVLAANAVIKQVAAESKGRAKLVDVFSKLCPFGHYQSVVDGVVTRTDGTHLSEAGADIVARWMMPQVGYSADPIRRAGDTTSTTASMTTTSRAVGTAPATTPPTPATPGSR